MMRALPQRADAERVPSGFDGRVGSKVPDSMSSQPLSNEATAQRGNERLFLQSSCRSGSH